MFTKTDIEKYFFAEKQESLLFIVVGVIALLTAIAFLIWGKTLFFRGAAIPLLLIGIIQLVVGFTVYQRSDEDRKRNVYAYDMNPGELKNKELPRMEKVNKNFVIYRWIEIVLTIVGLLIVFFSRKDPARLFWYGLGVALTIQAVIMLLADYSAENRAGKYTSGLVEYLQQKS